MNVCITLKFDGTNYHGFQVQKNAITICEVLQDALEKLYGTRPPVKGCSRTDAGVHALGYCVSFVQPKAIAPHKLPLAINHYLPQDIRVIRAVTVSPDFHARYSAISKEYIYRVHNHAVEDPFTAKYTWRVAYPLDVAAMQTAAAYYVGTHDFKAFMSAGSDIEDTIRTVHFFNVKAVEEEIQFHICADGYLYNMVRILVGTLIEVGAHRMSLQKAQTVLQQKDRAAAGDTVCSKGLFLYRVNYSEESMLHG